MNSDPFIAVGYDGSPSSDLALAWAARMADLRHEEIVATIVVDPRESPRGIAWPEFWWKEIEDQARAVLQQLPVVEYRLARQMGNKVSSLLAAGHDASMLVVGSHGHSVAGQVFLGSVSQSLARHATPPVVVVREPRTADAGRIVVGYDAHMLSRRALEFACTVAELTGDKVTLVHAWHHRSAAPDELRTDGPLLRTGSIDEQEAALQNVVEQMSLQHPTVGIDSDLVVDVSPGRALVHASSSASMVVVGAHTQNAVAEALLGSVSHEVLHRAHCTVAVLKPAAEPA
jgi:nucleotide-binding universal stress UspA family protein